MTKEQITAAHGEHTDHGTPRGFTSITPFLALADGGAALAFYRDVFGARVVNATEMGGVLVHAELEFTHGRLQLGTATPAHGLRAPDPGDDNVVYSLGVYVSDVDAVVERALAAGAVLREEVATFVSGDRFGSIRDPFGVRWSVMTRVEDLSDEESARRVKDWAAGQGE